MSFDTTMNMGKAIIATSADLKKDRVHRSGNAVRCLSGGHGKDTGMRTLIVRLGTMSDAKARFVNAGRKALEGSAQPVTPSINFVSYDDMHRVLARRGWRS